MRARDHPYPGVQLAAWNVTEDMLLHRYFPAKSLKLLRTSLLSVGQLLSTSFKATTSTARQYLTNKNSNVLLNAKVYIMLITVNKL